ncbi:MAG TPA: SMP-30/gluconolactonase/LRE family protein, partial [Chloroflexota bacterium]|nr:SMP-30/gluconolactonase/LRE family protein [Chloroflexota bacterium]
MVSDVELVLDAHAVLGEGPIWLPADNMLAWVDIMGHRVHRFDPLTGRDESFDVGQPVGAVAPR